MYGDSKMKMRMMALDKMRKEKPSVMMKKAEMEMPEGEGEEMGEEGFVQMMVSPEEKEMLMSIRKKQGMGAKMGMDEMEYGEEMA